ncbi:hypothetical protein Dda_7970 [Drechslerella dactyloides]|uniref:DUF1264-domain-containing protein n=1 Tax=Drechslerella dactyloides TaxID=74499 RepID=A0AAD6IT05_DREDA|nr:hypothetical protein Dda_7970 [Drechslerella dactyloides]
MASTVAGIAAEATGKPKDAFTGNGPLSNICGWLHGYHIYAKDPSRWVSAHHFCSPLGDDMRQCLIFDSPEQGARLIGVEYMISHSIFSTLPDDEKRLWHTHNFEVKSGMLVMPQPSISPTPTPAWNAVEDAEMAAITKLYGKTYHLWQVDKGHGVPLGEPLLMGSYTKSEQVPPELQKELEGRDKALGVSTAEKKERRQGIEESVARNEPAVDIAWK